MSKKVWLVIMILASILATRKCIKEQQVINKSVSKSIFTSMPYKINVPIKLEEQVPQKEVKEEIIQEPIIEKPSTYTTRMTSFYSGDECNTGSITASGLGENDFNVNENGWYTYQDKLVIATASTRLGYTDMRTYNLYDNINVIIDGIRYEGIVLDRCGACQIYNRIDLFVSNAESVIDKYVEVEL